MMLTEHISRFVVLFRFLYIPTTINAAFQLPIMHKNIAFRKIMKFEHKNVAIIYSITSTKFNFFFFEFASIYSCNCIVHIL